MAGKTEWEDALIKHGIMEAPEREEVREWQADTGPRDARERLGDASAAELDDAEDDAALFDDADLAAWREQRIAELRGDAAAKRAAVEQPAGRLGRLTSIGKDEYKAEVNNADKGMFVVLHLCEEGHKWSQLLNDVLARLAAKHPTTKFLRIVAREAIPNYPAHNLPTVLVYCDDTLKGQLIGINTFGGANLGADDVEWVLAKTGALTTTLEKNPMEARLGCELEQALKSSAYVGGDKQ